jgi:hypothetical protein
MNDWQFAEWDRAQTIASCMKASCAAAVFAAPRAKPVPEARADLAEAVRLAIAASLPLPDRLRILWVDSPYPAAVRSADKAGDITLAISVQLPSGDFFGTIFHELKHASDLHLGRPWNRIDYELRAEAFRFQMLRALQDSSW